MSASSRTFAGAHKAQKKTGATAASTCEQPAATTPGMIPTMAPSTAASSVSLDRANRKRKASAKDAANEDGAAAADAPANDRENGEHEAHDVPADHDDVDDDEHDASVPAAAPSGDDQQAAPAPGLEYTTRPNEFTSEIYKIMLSNLSYKCSVNDIKKILKKNNLDYVKIKKAEHWEHAYVTFFNEEQRKHAREVLDGFEYRHKKFVAKYADPMLDPCSRQGRDDRSKRRKRDDDEEADDATLPLSERLANKVTPLWKLPYEDQLKHKHTEMSNVLRKLVTTYKREYQMHPWMVDATKKNKGMVCVLEPIVPSPVQTAYRNKCEFAIGRSRTGQRKTIGFTLGAYQEGVVEVAEPYDCIHINDTTKTIVRAVQEYIQQSKFDDFDRITHKGVWRQLTVRTSETGEVMAALMVKHTEVTEAELQEEMDRMRAFFQDRMTAGLPLTSLLLLGNSSVSGMTDSEWIKPVLGPEYFHERLLGLSFRVSLPAFFQVNTKGAEVLLSVVRDWCGLQAGDETTVLDICCGTGTIGLVLAKDAKHVCGIEMVPEAIEDAKVNASLNNTTNVEFHVGKAEDVLPNITRAIAPSTPVVGVVDPPRAGLHPKVVQAIRRCDAIKRLVYVSCNPAAASANIIDFIRPTSKKCGGVPFKVDKAVPVDMFPQTDHCEMVMLLTRE